MKQAQKTFIYGVPGAGKTTYSLILKKELRVPLFEADQLRETVAQKEKTKEEDPFVYLGTTEAFRHFGPLTKENVTQGLHAVRNSMSPYVSKAISEFPDSLIMEGAFLDPERLSKLGRMVLVVMSDELKHRSHYFEHREQNQTTLENFETARMLQEYLQSEAQKYSVEIVENNF